MIDLRDLLGVPGHVVMIHGMTKQEIIDEAKAIMTHWEVSGYHSPDDVPESDEKERYRQLMKSLCFDVKF